MNNTTSLEAFLSEHEVNMTQWLKEPEQYRAFIARSNNKLLEIIRRQQEALKEVGKLTYSLDYESTGQDYGIVTRTLSDINQIADE